MAASQLMIFTAVPYSFSLNPAALPVSVVVSPRLAGKDKLGAYPDWLNWTKLRKQNGLRITFERQGASHTVDISRSILRPDLWEALFNQDTFVCSYAFDDYSDRFISSYPARPAIGLLQSTYQAAGIALAMPTVEGDPRERQARRRGLFESLVGGYALQWDEASGKQWRSQQFDLQRTLGLRFRGTSFRSGQVASLSSDGLLATGALTPSSQSFGRLQQDVVQRFGVFSHQPQGAPIKRASLDEKTVLDFHQALTSFNTYPVLQRMLGLVFDVTLPIDFLPLTDPDSSGTLRIIRVEGDWNADTPTKIPVTSTAYFHTVRAGTRAFGVASRHLVEQDQPLQIMGLLDLDPARYFLAQIDIDGALHKAIMLADTLTQSPGEAPPQHPEVFDPTTVLPSLRSSGMSLMADARAISLLETFQESQKFNDAIEKGQSQPRPFCAEDLVRGLRLDVWDAATGTWHSLHRRNASYVVGNSGLEVKAEDEEGFFQVAATQEAPRADGTRVRDDLYLHEALCRWAGWSLSAGMPGKHLTRSGDPDKAVPNAADPDPENEAITPFKMTTKFDVVKGNLPRLRFGGAYRFRIRVVDLAGNGLKVSDEATKLLTPDHALPSGDRVIPYLRFEAIASPVIVLRDKRGITGEGSSIDRLVIRSFNADRSLDSAAADVTNADRHIAPPRSSVEMAERHGLFDSASGQLNASSAMWQLIKDRDEGNFAQVKIETIVIDGDEQEVPLEPADRIDALPYLPDALARGAALRNLPGTLSGVIGQVEPGAGAAAAIAYDLINDANPRPGSATIIGFGGHQDWQEVKPFRLAMGEGNGSPNWDPANRLLTVFLPKASTYTVPLSSWTEPEDLKLMGVWQWLRESVEFATSQHPDEEFYKELLVKDRIAHVLQLAREGGHSMLTPPHLLTLVHAVQQPIGRPTFSRLTMQLNTTITDPLQTQPEGQPTAVTELAILSSWRKLGSTDASLIGALQIHGASTAKVDIVAEWTDPVDDLAEDAPAEQLFSGHVDEVPLARFSDGYLTTAGDRRAVAYYDADRDLMCFAPAGSLLGNLASGVLVDTDAAPRHRISDAKHHLVKYAAVATSRYREYFPSAAADGTPLVFTRESEPVEVHVPASARPVAPQVLYVVPTFGWERETVTNQKRSVRMGGGLRIYLDRPWYSSGRDELLGVTLVSELPVDREDWKPFISQWGQDPIWTSVPLGDFPQVADFPDAVATELGLPLDVQRPDSTELRKVGVAGHEVHFDTDRKLWYCDLVVNPGTATFAPFVRLALVRYQPYALVEAKLSRVVLADFAQLTPERASTVTADPYNPGSLRVAISGPAPHSSTSIAGVYSDRRTVISVTVQKRNESLHSDLAWADSGDFAIEADPAKAGRNPDFVVWSGSVCYLALPDRPKANRYRLLIEEHEIVPADGPDGRGRQRRLIYLETILLDAALLSPAETSANSTTVD
jgi:hypothetical protein